MAHTLRAVPGAADERVPFSNLQAQHDPISGELQQAMAQVVANSAFVLGPAVERFEESFSRYCGAAHAVACNSGTSAIHMALRAADVGPGDEVITVANTFVGTVWGILYCGATPVFVDVDADTLTMNVEQVAEHITPRTRAIIPVHLYGQPVDMDPLMELAQRHGLWVIEDAAQAHGARYRGRRAGALGHMACFSFYPGKNLGAWGEGGAVLTSDPALYSRLRGLRDHAQSRRYRHEELGFNYRMDGIQGAVLDVKLRHLDRWNARRRELAALYSDMLSGMEGIRLPLVRDWAESSWHLYVVRLAGRDGILAAMDARGISCGLHYPVPLHLQEAVRSARPRHGALPVTCEAAGTVLSLPLYPELDNDAAIRVVESLKELLEEGAA